jgi:hypothetical protein
MITGAGRGVGDAGDGRARARAAGRAQPGARAYPLEGGPAYPICARSGIFVDVMSFSADLPGADLVRTGLGDLARDQVSVEALLVSIGAPRLRRCGIDVPNPVADPEHRLYALLAAADPDGAHSRYNALIRRLVSFERAAARASP